MVFLKLGCGLLGWVGCVDVLSSFLVCGILVWWIWMRVVVMFLGLCLVSRCWVSVLFLLLVLMGLRSVVSRCLWFCVWIVLGVGIEI